MCEGDRALGLNGLPQSGSFSLFPKQEDENEQADGDTEGTMESSLGIEWNVLKH